VRIFELAGCANVVHQGAGRAGRTAGTVGHLRTRKLARLCTFGPRGTVAAAVGNLLEKQTLVNPLGQGAGSTRTPGRGDLVRGPGGASRRQGSGDPRLTARDHTGRRLMSRVGARRTARRSSATSALCAPNHLCHLLGSRPIQMPIPAVSRAGRRSRAPGPRVGVPGPDTRAADGRGATGPAAGTAGRKPPRAIPGARKMACGRSLTPAASPHQVSAGGEVELSAGRPRRNWARLGDYQRLFLSYPNVSRAHAVGCKSAPTGLPGSSHSPPRTGPS